MWGSWEHLSESAVSSHSACYVRGRCRTFSLFQSLDMRALFFTVPSKTRVTHPHLYQVWLLQATRQRGCTIQSRKWKLISSSQSTAVNHVQICSVAPKGQLYYFRHVQSVGSKYHKTETGRDKKDTKISAGNRVSNFALNSKVSYVVCIMKWGQRTNKTWLTFIHYLVAHC